MSDPHPEPVPARRRREALRFLVAGGARDPYADARGHAFDQQLRARGADGGRLWWTRHRRRCTAAAVAVTGPGRVAMLFHASADAAGVDREALAATLRAAADDALATGAAFAQALTPPGNEGDIACLMEAGFGFLAELRYLRKPLSGPVAATGDGKVTWRTAAEVGDAALGELIRCTYEGTLDCPALSGLRRTEDVLAGHRAAGTYRPEWWRVAENGGEPAGCVLLNDMGPTSAEVVYMGAAPAHRGRGLGAALLRRAAGDAQAAGKLSVTLAVDAANTYARRIYEREGFAEVQRRVAHIRTRG